MAGFRKAKAEQAALKMGFYGTAGSGKTFTALLVAEGLAKVCGKRVAVVDTERGTDWYSMDIPDRKSHPKAFDFDALYTRSITETYDAVRQLKPEEYCVVVIDSISHLWEAAMNAYSGKLTKIGTIPVTQWGRIKKPYKELLNYLLSSQMHLILCGRQGNIWETDEETDELKKVGTKMKAEGETPYEPHILIHMEVQRTKGGESIITAYAEKDRTGILAGKVIAWPTFDSIAKPLLSALGDKQAHIPDDEETGGKDAEKLTEKETERELESARLLAMYKAKMALCTNFKELEEVTKTLTSELKKTMLTEHVADLKEAYLTKARELKGQLVT